LASLSAKSSAIVFENMSGVTTNYYMFGRQYGDDINLAGGGRIVTQFTFLYFGNVPTNLISPGEWRIRFYKNDGALENPAVATSQKPNSLIWDSGLHPVRPGYQMTTLAVPQVTVPDRFTWTVEFSNLPQDSNNGAGLVLANPPTIGATLPGKTSTVIGSYTDFWMLEEADVLDSWTLQIFSNNPNVGPQGNFFAQVVTKANPNKAPVWISAALNRRVSEGSTLSFQLRATDSDLPPQSLTYRLISGPTGLTVSTNGIVSWQPTEAQGPSTNRVRVDVHDGVEGTSQEFDIVVQEQNLPPTWTAPGTRRVSEGLRLSFQLKATDADLPAQPLTYRLVSGPTGLTVTTNGLLSWTPTQQQGPSPRLRHPGPRQRTHNWGGHAGDFQQPGWRLESPPTRHLGSELPDRAKHVTRRHLDTTSWGYYRGRKEPLGGRDNPSTQPPSDPPLPESPPTVK